MKDWKLRKRGAGYVVVNGSGASVSPGFATDDEALDWVARRARAQAPKRRPCLCCGRAFASEGIQDRLCAPCGQRSDLVSAGTGGSTRRATARRS